MASGFTTKEWKQRISEFATRRLLSIVSQSSGNMTVDVSRAEGLVSQVGDAFSPENMNSLEQRIADAFANVDSDVAAAKKSASDGKSLIAAAITEKKVAASASDTFAVLANKIKQIVLGSGNAAKADVLSGKTFTNDDGVEYTGTMPNRGSYGYSAVNSTGSGAAGYYSGITVDTRPSYTSGYNAGVTDADARINTESANYKGGYNAGHAAGVTAADARVNKNSASYAQGVNDADARSNPGSVNYQTGYNAGYSAGYGSGQTIGNKTQADGVASYGSAYEIPITSITLAAGTYMVSGFASAVSGYEGFGLDFVKVYNGNTAILNEARAANNMQYGTAIMAAGLFTFSTATTLTLKAAFNNSRGTTYGKIICQKIG